MRCDEAMGRCNVFRIFRDEGRCNFGFITPASEDQEATNGPETEVYIKSIFSSFLRVLITSSPRHGLSRPIRLTWALVGVGIGCLGTRGLGKGLDKIF